MDRYSSVAFPIYCYRNIIAAWNKLPQEAGFIWWFRFNYSLSSTIWNQCSWRKNPCLRQWNRSSETSLEKKRRPRSSLRASAVNNWLHYQMKSLGRLRLQSLWPRWPLGDQCNVWFQRQKFCCNTAGQQHVYSICRWWTRTWKQRRAYETYSAKKRNTELQHNIEDVNVNAPTSKSSTNS